ncbi:hypothetical protein MPTK1_3g06740 [Marchantia polymorpha subsp. ruderalis]|uniref:Uncharacterized protein n=2 Tax=Marchantia polymorpha TaxID=3197 RepID=A0AAF6AY40_MARPO|nr:hypothetical protein MARPO_0006s0142 [Marchantia polymorpha]BBN04674.1 hypothetical protein Mp_3g06740 [Marchantia polymorpha subsp. ruderalis]|eukprot:PTQ48112.1 hypothetical protein MARPO_0006s0142 [Marchantia polymorpha]
MSLLRTDFEEVDLLGTPHHTTHHIKRKSKGKRDKGALLDGSLKYCFDNEGSKYRDVDFDGTRRLASYRHTFTTTTTSVTQYLLSHPLTPQTDITPWIQPYSVQTSY